MADIAQASPQDYAQWKLKADAIRDLGLSERTIERLIQAGRIRTAQRRVPGRRPLTVLHPDDVEQIRREIIPAQPTGPPPVPAARHSNGAPLPSLSFEAFQALLRGPAVPLHRKLYLTVAEAVAYSGLPKAVLLRWIHAGTLPAIRAGGYRIRRADLERRSAAGGGEYTHARRRA